jgi:hypothetical protein
MHKFESAETKASAKRPKEPFDPALGAPIVLALNQLEKVAAGFISLGGGGTTTGAAPPPPTPPRAS